MRRHFIAVFAAAVAFAVSSDPASANLLRSRNKSATISALSEQLLQQPASAAGRYRNVWDADPPEPAVGGFHYFLYNLNAQGEPLGAGNESLTVKAIAAGPGYQITGAQVLLKTPGSDNPPFFANVPQNANDSYDATSAFADFTQFYELGVMRISFSLVNGPATGYINGQTDSAELGYVGELDNGQRGVEHARIFTETRDGHDNDTPRGIMTAFVPDDFLTGMTFDNGYLDYGDGDVATGYNVHAAPLNSVIVPEPAALAVVATGVTMLLRRRRAGRPAVA